MSGRRGSGRRRWAGAAPGREPATLLFFHSDASGPSRRMDGLVSGLYLRERRRLRLRRIDVDARPDVAERLGVAAAPALLLVRGSRVVARLAGEKTAEELRARLLPHIRA